MIWLQYLGWGWLILGAAIFANALMKWVGGATWYDYINRVAAVGLKAATASLHPAEIVFLVLIYPGILGFVVYLASRP